MNFITLEENYQRADAPFDSSVLYGDNQDYLAMDVAAASTNNTSSPLISSIDKDEYELWKEFENFRNMWETLIEIYVPLEISIMSLGLIGNFLALATLIRSQNLCTPSFVYHRALVFADFLFCLNYFFHVFVEKFATVNNSQFEFGRWWTAYYSAVVYHAIHLTCTYVILYMTSVIALDRFVALLIYKKYAKFNRVSVASTVVTLCVALSAFVHSWAPWVQRQVVVQKSVDHRQNRYGDNATIFFTWIKRQNLSDDVKTALQTKDIYNGIVRIAYPLIISLLTVGVIYGFIRRQRHITVRYASATTVTTGRQRSRYEKTLFFFMIAVVVLTFVEIGSSEGRRFLEIIYPPGEISAKKVTNWKLPLTERLYYFRVLLYGYQISRLVSNLCTAFNRSFVCYLYVVMNNLFRKELAALLCCCRPVEPPGLMRPRTSSHSTTFVHKISGNSVLLEGRSWIRAKTSTVSLKNPTFL